MDYRVILLSTFLVFCQALDIKTRQLCCKLGTNYSTDHKTCKTLQPPIPGVPIEDERACLNTVDFCCKKELRVLQCNAGKEDAKTSCSEEDRDRKECCEACKMGIEAKKLGYVCDDSLGLGPPFSEVYINCCEDAVIGKQETVLTASTTAKIPVRTEATISAESAKYSKPVEDAAQYPGLSEENVCETEEFCAQMCVPIGKTYKCGCFPGYELMKDEVSCKPLKSATGSRCKQNNPCDHDCIDTGISIECSCRKGYELGADKKACKDIDECALGIHECEPGEECENDEGTYFCFVTELDTDEEGFGKCPVGHKFNSEKSVCDDVDECQFSLICPSPKVCRNSIGSFSCEGPDCPPGFYYKPSIETCADIDECISGDNNCDKDSELCINTKGNYTCVDKASRKACPPGFKKNDATLRCEDINECDDNLPICSKDEECINEEGGYKCAKLKSARPKVPFVAPTPPPPITPKPLEPSSCPKGYKLNSTQNTCDDINECQLRTDNCSPTHRCDNTIGSFYCSRTVSCGTGYTLNSGNDLCEDDDECSMGTDNCKELGPSYQCKNQMGTFKCEFTRPTYRPIPTSPATIPTTARQNIRSKYPTVVSPSSPPIISNTKPNTIILTTHTTVKTTPVPTTPPPAPTSNMAGPQATLRPISITNAWGQPFYSSNRNKWSLPSRPVTAVQYTPAEHFRPVPSAQVTKKFFPEPYNPYSRTPYNPFQNSGWRTTSLPIINGVLKQCLSGYRITAKGDCEGGISGTFHKSSMRERETSISNGISYLWEVPEVPKNASVIHHWKDVDECESNPCPRGSKCLNFNGGYQCSSPLHCKIGYEPNEAEECVDVDECAKGTHNCSKTQICKNGLGYYTCECPAGHHLDRSTQTCEDLDECKYYRPCGNYADCTNTVGSYMCACKSGFKMNNNFCEDLNECQDVPNLCQDTCINIWGSYRCACKPGFTLNSDNRTCNDIDECEKFKDRKLCVGTCLNTPGSYVCECPKGYKLGRDKRACIDIDECQHNVCAAGNVCVNTRGGFMCYPITCTANYVPDPYYKAKCQRRPCDLRDNKCLLLPENYSYQFMSLYSNLPLSEGGIPLYKLKGPSWEAARADFYLKLVEVNCPPGVERVNDSYFKKVLHEDNKMELNLVKSIQGPQEVKLKVEMKLFQGNNNLIGSVVVYIVIIVSEHPF